MTTYVAILNYNACTILKSGNNFRELRSWLHLNGWDNFTIYKKVSS